MFIMYLYSLYIGSLFPDIDHHKSYIGSKLPTISTIIRSKFGHRGFMHSLLLIYCLIIVSFLMNISFKIFYPHVYSVISIYIQTLECGFILGCMSHILFDMFICIFYPDTKKHQLPLAPIIKLNSSSEKALYNFLSFLNSILLIYYLSLFIKNLLN